MPTTKKAKSSLSETARRAALRKADSNLRHAPNEHDLRIVPEYAVLMTHPQSQAVNAASQGKKNYGQSTTKR